MEKLIRAGMRNPVLISVKEKDNPDPSNSATPASLDNFYMVCEPDRKFASLVRFLRENLDKAECKKVMLFFATCAEVEYFALVLSRLLKGANILAIHGKKAKRHKVFEAFKKAESGEYEEGQVLAFVCLPFDSCHGQFGEIFTVGCLGSDQRVPPGN